MDNFKWPLVEYAQKIGKNTAEFTAVDMAAFMRWHMSQPQREDLLNMAKKYTTKKFQDAQTGRLAEQGIDIEQDDNIIEDIQEEVVVVCSMELTRVDVSSLIWGLEILLNEYDLEENEMGITFKTLLEGLKEV